MRDEALELRRCFEVLSLLAGQHEWHLAYKENLHKFSANVLFGYLPRPGECK